MLIFDGFFLPMVATFSEASAVTSSVVKQGMNNSNSFKTYELNWSQSSIFALN